MKTEDQLLALIELTDDYLKVNEQILKETAKTLTETLQSEREAQTALFQKMIKMMGDDSSNTFLLVFLAGFFGSAIGALLMLLLVRMTG